jgi:hypothetical protein
LNNPIITIDFYEFPNKIILSHFNYNFRSHMSQENTPNPEERKLEPYHYEAMIRAEVEKRLAAEREKTGSQEIISRTTSETQYQQSAQPANPTWPAPNQPGNMPAQPYQYPAQPQQYYSGQLPAYQQPQPQPPAYYQPQPQPYYPPQQPPAQPVINVVVQNSNVNQNVNRNYYSRRYTRAHGHIGCFNVCYFLLIGWALGLSAACVGICVLPFSKTAGDEIMRLAFFLAFLA